MPDKQDASAKNYSLSATNLSIRIDLWKWLVLPVVGVTMTIVSWQKWEDLIVDFGQQAYVPWQLSEGQILYRDIFYIYGPLSSYVHALLFKIFGPGILVLAWFNIGLIVGLTIILYQLFRNLSDARTANFICLTFLGVFAFGQYKLGGNYNFVCAYVYELPHGIFIGFVALLQFKKYLDHPLPKRLGLVGFLTGLIFLTKPEVFFAAIIAIGSGLCLTLYLRQPSNPIKTLIPFVVGLVVPPTVFIIFQSFHMPVADSVYSIFSPYLFLLNSDLRALPLYKWIMGTNDPWANLSTMVLYFLVFSLSLFLIYLVNRVLRNSIQKYSLGFNMSACLLIAYALIFALNVPWLSLGRPLPLLMMVFGAFLLIRIFKNRPDPSPQALGQFVLVVFALVLLLKMLLNAHIYHYGFALALPSTLILVAFLVYELPLRLQPLLESSQFYRSVMITLVLVFVGYHAWFTSLIYELKNYPVSSDRDLVIDYDRDFNNRGEIMNLALNYIDNNLQPETTFATFPDGIILNYLSRRKNSIADITLNPGVWVLVGDDAVLERLKKASPAYIVYMDREFPYFGLNKFGKDFAQKIDGWIKNHYTVQAQFGATPFSGEGFGIQILRKKLS
jgi:dolichyl-phosphate-mannose-protein mannosyltransferase